MNRLMVGQKCHTLRLSKLTWNFQRLIFGLFESCSKKVVEGRCQESPEPRSFLDDVILKKIPENFFFVFFNNFSLFVIDVVFVSKNHQVFLTFIYRNSVNNIYQKMVNVAVLCHVVLTSSKIIRHFENSQLSFTWHKMTSIVPQVSLPYQFYFPPK